jgi:putative oxidoreductase
MIHTSWCAVRARLEAGAAWLPPLLLRLILAWEFWEAGVTKLRGSNWFAGVQSRFPFPFDLVPAQLSWSLATWTELLGALALLLGLGTRLAAFALLVLTFVATAAVHWPESWDSLAQLWQGYAITDTGAGNFKLPLLFAIMLLPLVFGGAGRISVDDLLSGRRRDRGGVAAIHDRRALALALAVLAVPLLFLLPLVGIALGLAAVGLAWRAASPPASGAETPPAR